MPRLEVSGFMGPRYAGGFAGQADVGMSCWSKLFFASLSAKASVVRDFSLRCQAGAWRSRERS
jgi:hypothetical protein